jgi:hypothetical protein
LDSSRLRINAENVVHETVDGEVIVIDLTNGSYYSLAGSGPTIWEMLAAGASAPEICAALKSGFEAEPDVIEASVSSLLARLRENELVTVDGESSAPLEVHGNGNGAAREPFAPPVFERYTDMKDYFLLDPIHEVGPTGWPNKPGE